MALPKAVRVADDGELKIVAAAALVPGQVMRAFGPYAGVVMGTQNISIGEPAVLALKGQYEIACASGTTASAGAEAFYNTSTTLVVTAAGANCIQIGRFAKAKTSGQLVATIQLNAGLGEFGGVKQVFREFTTAEVNAGADVLPAKTGIAYRLVDAAMIAVGGAASGATAVRLNGTQATSVVQLVSNAVAGLTQNTLLRAGAANSTILAAGASFATCDAGAAITIDKSGSSLATATAIDVLLTYVEVAS